MFDNIVGHDKLKEMFSKNKDLKNAYLFVGPEKIGKFLFAMELAEYYSGGIKQNMHIINKDTIAVDDIRTICEDIQRFPYMNKKRIIVINDAYKLNEISQNTLLKTLEEPPANCHFFLITNDTTKLLDTIISRCCVCKFDYIDNNIINNSLKNEINIEDENLLDFITGCVIGQIGRIFELKNDSDKLKYYQKMFDLSNKLEANTNNKNVLQLVEEFTTDNNNILFVELLDLLVWFAHKYIKTGENKYKIYSNIINDTLDKISRGGNVLLATDVLVIRILKFNDVNERKKKNGN